MHIVDPYTAHCLDEAVCYIMIKIQDGEQPVFVQKYKSFSDLYRNYR